MPYPPHLEGTDLVMRTSTTAATSGGAAGANKLWLPLWSGEVINAYDQYNVFEGLVMQKNLTGGQSWEFPVTGVVALKAAWAAGEELYGGDASSTTFKVNLDPRPMAAHFTSDNIDRLITQWDYVSELGAQCGKTLANARDKQIISTILAATALPALSGDPRGSLVMPAPQVVSANAASAATPTEARAVLTAIENYCITMQENDYPVNSPICAVTPKVWHLIRALGVPTGTITNNVISPTEPLFTGNPTMGGQGQPMSAGMNTMTEYLEWCGVKIIKTNHLPTTNLAAAPIGAAKYNLDAADIKLHGLIFQKEAIGSIKLIQMQTKVWEDVPRNSTLTFAMTMNGTGILRPELCQALVGATTSANLDSRAELFAELDTDSVLTQGFAAEYKVTA